MSLDDAKGTSVDAPVIAVLSGLDGIFILNKNKEQHQMFFLVKNIFLLYYKLILASALSYNVAHSG